MKKIFLLLVMCAMSSLFCAAKDSIPNTAPRSVMLARAGDTYYVGNEEMSITQTLQWLKAQDCKVAYDLFRVGFHTSIVGWGLMGAGLIIEAAGVLYMTTSVERRSAQGLVRGYLLYGLGGALEIAAIPTIAVGYHKMHQTPNVYNTFCYRTADARPYWTIQASGNGIGLAYKF